MALIHGTNVSVDPRLARAAAAAAAFALDAARLEAEVRTRAVEVSDSRRRLLSVADAERRSLEQRLNDGVLARLRRVERLFVTQGDAAEPLGAELSATIAELTALGRGLYPPALARVDLMRALAEIAERSPVPTVVEAEGNLGSLSEAYRATIWFICSEGLANVARHSNATNAAVVLREREQSLELEIRDNGRGGAVLGRGLRGIAARVDALGGRVVLSSPSGGPTTLRASIGGTNTATSIRSGFSSWMESAALCGRGPASRCACPILPCRTRSCRNGRSAGEPPDRRGVVNAVENDTPGPCESSAAARSMAPSPATIAPSFRQIPRSRTGPSCPIATLVFGLAVQQRAAERDPGATVVGYAYFNYFAAPTSGVTLNENILIGFCPSGWFYPRSADATAWVQRQWRGWAQTGASCSCARTTFWTAIRCPTSSLIRSPMIFRTPTLPGWTERTSIR